MCGSTVVPFISCILPGTLYASYMSKHGDEKDSHAKIATCLKWVGMF